MADGSKIEWCDATFNPWSGCTKVSAACDNCYAERWGARFGVEWGNHPRRRTSESYWTQPLKWDRAAQRAGERKTVFCASLADWLDNQVDPVWRGELGTLIARTPNLDWLLLSKRPQNYETLAPWPVSDPPPNVSLGTTIENQAEADRRIPEILRWRARWHFISAEPLLGPIDLRMLHYDGITNIDALTGLHGVGRPHAPGTRIDWTIAGGESGPGARPAHPDWVRSLRDQCQAAGVAFFFKQWGEWQPHKVMPGGDLGGGARADRVRIVHPSGRSDVEISIATSGRSTEPGSRYMARVGKKAAGRLLDGREHSEFPA